MQFFRIAVFPAFFCMNFLFVTSHGGMFSSRGTGTSTSTGTDTGTSLGINGPKQASPSMSATDYSVRVDPHKIIRLICKHVGMVLPDYVIRDLDIISSLCRCDETSLDLINKKLTIQNLRVITTIGVKNDDHDHDGGTEKAHCTALRVGTCRLAWDSYLTPCIDIEVEDVDVLVEFLNLIFTRNNWNNLAERGFPPKFYENDTKSVPAAEASTFFRIGSMKMMGEIRLKIRSRPLGRDLLSRDIIFDLGKLEALNKKIRSASRRRKNEKHGRRGLTSEELYDIIHDYFGRQIRQLVKVVRRLGGRWSFSRKWLHR